MKVTVNVDCTPEEARTFLGLPDVKPLQETIMTVVEERMRKNIDSMDPETILKTWVPAGLQGFEALQKMFWGQVQAASNKGNTEE